MPAPPAAAEAGSPRERRGRRLFTAGAVLLMFLGLVHSLSLLKAPVAANPTEQQLFELMSNYKFRLPGSLRSMQDLLTGFSISFTLAALGMGAVDFLLRRSPAPLVKRVALLNTLWLAALTTVSLRYFFAAPTSFLAADLILFLLAAVTRPASAAGPAPDER